MKRQLIVGAVLAVLLAAGVHGVNAGPFGGRGGGFGNCGGCEEPCGMMHGRHGARQAMDSEEHVARMAEMLGLSDAQRQKIEAIHKAESEKIEPIQQRLMELREKLWGASQADTFDEEAVSGIAAEKAQLMTEMMVSRMRMHNQVHALLTPEQQEQAKKHHGPMGDGPRHKPCFSKEQ